MPTYVLGTDGTSVFQILVNQGDGNSIEVIPVDGATPSTNLVSNAINQTAYDLIASAMRLIGVAASGEPISLSEANDGLMVFNQMLDSWNADRLAVYTTSSQDFAFVSGQQAYTLGPGGDFVMNRPAQIDSVSVILTSNPSNPIEIPISMYSVDQWQGIPIKSTRGSIPLVCYDDGGFPNRTLNFWPIPTGNSVRLYSWQPLGAPATLQSYVSYPFGYAEAFRYNLAVRLSAEFSAPLPPAVAAIAMSSLARVKSMNTPDMSMQSDLAPSGGNDIAYLFGIPFRGPSR